MRALTLLLLGALGFGANAGEIDQAAPSSSCSNRKPC